MKPLYETVRANLLTAMKGRSQAECSRNAGKGRAWFNGILNGKRGSEDREDITLDTLDQLGKAVGVPPWMLLLPSQSPPIKDLVTAGHSIARRLSGWAEDCVRYAAFVDDEVPIICFGLKRGFQRLLRLVKESPPPSPPPGGTRQDTQEHAGTSLTPGKGC